jgi:hypothetical protein
VFKLMMYIPVFASTVLFVFFTYVFFLKQLRKKDALTGIIKTVLLSPGAYVCCVELVNSVGSAVPSVPWAVQAVTTVLAYLLPFAPFCYLYGRLIKQRSEIALFIYVSFIFMKFISGMMTGCVPADVGVTIILFTIWFLLFKEQIAFLTERSEEVDCSLFCAAGSIILVITIGLMKFTPYFSRFLHGTALSVFSVWLDCTCVLLFVLFLLLVKSNFNNIHQAVLIRAAATMEAERSKEMLSAQENVIISFAEILESKSGGTGNHAKRVSEYCRILAEDLGFSARDIENIRIASMMHDIGKLMVPNEILEKSGRLSVEEKEEMKKHVIYGKKMLENAAGTIMRYARIITFQHHERWDGSGYPCRLRGEQIDPVSRVVSLADVFDALVSRRSYKEPWTPEKARAEIVGQRGKQFAPECVDAFVRTYDEFLAVIQAYPDDRCLL